MALDVAKVPIINMRQCAFVNFVACHSVAGKINLMQYCIRLVLYILHSRDSRKLKLLK